MIISGVKQFLNILNFEF